jgi:Uma2 family endonuclease
MARELADHPIRTERRSKMPYEEYLSFVDETTHSEWVDGEVTIFRPASVRHQELSIFLSTVLATFLAASRLGRALYAPFEMKLRAGRSYREPDILVLLNEHQDRLTDQRLDGPADVVFELVSPDSTARDRREKFREYEQAGIPEYWIIDAREGQFSVAVYVLSESGSYVLVQPDERGRIHSVILPGFWLDPNWLSGDELPDVIEIYRAMLPSIFGA